MTLVLPNPGDVIDVTVTSVKPFGSLVETRDGTPGLLRPARGANGTTVRVTVTDVDQAEARFTATPTD